jgi:hypothetical protein
MHDRASADNLQIVGVKGKVSRIDKPEAVDSTACASRSAAYSAQGGITPSRDVNIDDNTGCSPSNSDCQGECPLRLEIPLQPEHRVQFSDPVSVSGISVDQRALYHTWSTIRPSVDTNRRSTSAPAIEKQASSGVQDAISAEASLSMLRTYRYRVAPWVSGAEHRFLSTAD